MLKRELFLGVFRKNYFVQIMSISFLIFFVSIIRQNSWTNLGTVLILSQIITASIASSYVFQDDYQDTSLEQLLISGQNRVYFIISKVIAYCLAIFFSSLINLIMVFLTYKMSVLAFLCISVVLVLNSLVFSSLSSFVGALTLTVHKANFIQLIISIPLTISLALYSISIIDQIFLVGVRDYGFFITDLKILLAISLLLVPITICACSYLIAVI